MRPGVPSAPAGAQCGAFPAPGTPMPAVPCGRSLCTVPGPRRGLFLRPSVSSVLAGAQCDTSRHQTPPCLPFPHGAACAQSPALRRRLFLCPGMPSVLAGAQCPVWYFTISSTRCPRSLVGRSLHTASGFAEDCFCALVRAAFARQICLPAAERPCGRKLFPHRGQTAPQAVFFPGRRHRLVTGRFITLTG